MAETVKFGSGVFKDAQGNIVRINGLTQNDINKVKQALADIETLKDGVKAANSGQRELAYTDLTLPEAPTTGLVSGTYYMVPFNNQDEFLEFDKSTGKPKNPQTVPATTDLIVKYFTIMYFNGTALSNVGRQDVQANIQHVVYDNANATLTGTYTFNNNIVVTATQDTSLADNQVATAKYVKDAVAGAGHMIGEFAASDPADGTLIANKMVFYAAVDQLV